MIYSNFDINYYLLRISIYYAHIFNLLREGIGLNCARFCHKVLQIDTLSPTEDFEFESGILR